MRKKLGVIALMLSGIAGVAFGQDGYYNYCYYDRDHGNHYYRQNDRDWNRHQRREWKEHQREERREREWRRQSGEWRQNERQERRFDRPSFRFDYRR